MPNDTVDTVPFPKPPSQMTVSTIEDVNTFLDKQARYNRDIARYSNELYNILHNGYLVRDFQVENLSASKISAGTIAADDIYLFDDRFRLNGSTGQIVIKDENNTDRFVAGKFGSGVDYGAKIYKSDGSVLVDLTGLGLNVVTNQNVDPNANISGTKLADATIGSAKIANAAITNAKIDSLSASKITLSGTLEINTSATAIDCTGAGACVFSNGGDIIMRASPSGDTNYLSFRTSGNAIRGSLTYSVTSNEFRIAGVNVPLKLKGQGPFTYIDLTANGIVLNSNSGTGFINMISAGGNFFFSPQSVTVHEGNFRSNTHNAHSLGSSGIRWANMWSVLVNGADFCFDNGWRLTEFNNVWKAAKPEDGIVLMNDKWEVIATWDRVGNMAVKGFVMPGVNFAVPDVPRREAIDTETQVRNGKAEYIN